MSELLDEKLNIERDIKNVPYIDFSIHNPAEIMVLHEKSKFLNRNVMDSSSIQILEKLDKELDLYSCFGIKTKQSRFVPPLSTLTKGFIENLLSNPNPISGRTDLDKREHGELLTPRQRITYAIHKELKSFESLESFLKISKDILEIFDNAKNDKKNLFTKSIDKNLFINLTLNTVLNEPITNCLKILDAPVIFAENFEYFIPNTFTKDYLETYRKSALRQLSENLVFYEETEIYKNILTSYTKEGFMDRVAPHLEALGYDGTFSTSMGYTSLCESLYNLEVSLCHSNPSANSHIQYDLYNPTLQLSTESTIMDIPFLTAFASKNNKNTSEIKDSIDEYKLHLASKLPNYIQTYTFLRLHNDDFLEAMYSHRNGVPSRNDIIESIVSINKPISNTPCLYYDYERLVLDNIKAHLISDYHFSRKEATEFVRDVQHFKSDDYNLKIFKDEIDGSFIFRT